MLLKHLRIENFCNHKEFEADFLTGVTGIIGPNGSGKSNIVRAIKASLTNDFSFGGRKKEEHISYGSDDRSYIEATWHIAGEDRVLVRSLRPSRSTMGDLRNDQEIRRELERLLGVADIYQLVSKLFVHQWEMFSFFTASRAVRADDFAALCGLSRAEEILSLVSSQITAESAPVVADLQDSIQQEIDALTRSIDSTKARIDAMSEQVLTDEELATIEAAIRQSAASVKAAEEVKRLEARVLEEEKKLQSLKEQSHHAEEKKNAADVVYDKLRAQAARESELRHKLSEIIKVKANLKAATEDLELEASIAPQPPKWPRYLTEQVSELSAKIATMRSRSEFLTQAIARASDLESAECLLCRSLLHDPQSFAEGLVLENNEVKLALEKAEAEQVELRRINREWMCYDAALVESKSRTSHAEHRISRAESDLKELELSDEERKAVESGLASEEKVRAAKVVFQSAAAAAEVANNQLMSCAGSVIQLQFSLKSFSMVADRSKLTPEQDRSLTVRRAAHYSATGAFHELRESLEEKRKERLKKTEALSDNKLVLAAAEKLGQWTSKLSTWKSVLHRDQLPAVVVASTLDAVADAVNRKLEFFGNPFVVEADMENVSLAVVKQDGRRERADGLSGGQMVVLACAYHLATNDMFFGEHGLLVLDEPTVGLDDQSIDGLCDALSGISAAAASRNQQVIVVTHDHRLSRIFDRVISLS